MLADKRAYTLASNFGAQWLNLAKLAEINPDPATFPYASGTDGLRSVQLTDAMAKSAWDGTHVRLAY